MFTYSFMSKALFQILCFLSFIILFNLFNILIFFNLLFHSVYLTSYKVGIISSNIYWGYGRLNNVFKVTSQVAGAGFKPRTERCQRNIGFKYCKPPQSLLKPPPLPFWWYAHHCLWFTSLIFWTPSPTKPYRKVGIYSKL